MSTQSIYKSPEGQQAILNLCNSVLATWPVDNEQFTVSTRYGDTFIIAGRNVAAPPLILLHGSGSNAATWMGDSIELSKHYRVYAVDIPGEPGKSEPTRFGWDGNEFVEWLDDVLDALDIDTVILGGISLGGWATLKYAVERPSRVNAAVSICPSGIHPPRLSFALRAIFYMLTGEWGLKKMKEYIFNGADFPPELDQYLTLVARHFNYRVGAPPLFTDVELQSLKMPVFFLAGENDVMLNTPKTAERLQRLVPDLTAKVYKNAGHATVNQAKQIIEFLQKNVPKPAS